ncbi:MAG: AAA family ATPase [Actinomycetota bacterium]
MDFKNTLLIMTSSLGGALYAEDWLGAAEKHDRVLETMRAHFKPEFLSRVDAVLVFDQLTRQQLAHIVDIQVDLLRKRLVDRHLQIMLTDKAKAYLVDKGFDPAYGARPLKRLIQKEIQDRLAMELLKGEITEGDTVDVDTSPEGLVFHNMESNGPAG